MKHIKLLLFFISIATACNSQQVDTIVFRFANGDIKYLLVRPIGQEAGSGLDSIYVSHNKLRALVSPYDFPINNATQSALNEKQISGSYVLTTNNLSDLSNAGTARTNLGLAIGTNTQAYDADLTTFAGISPSANIQSLLGSADYSAARTAIGLAIGTNVQAYDADLTTWAGITPTTVGQNIAALTNPSALGFIRVNADNTVTHRSYANTKVDLSLDAVTNESKATMFTNSTFTGTLAVPNSVITNNNLAGSINYSKMDNATVPTWNQNTSGSAATLTTPKNINGSAFNGSADIQTDNDILAYLALGSPVLSQTVNQKLEYANTSTNMVDNQIKYEVVYLPKAATLTGIKVYVRVLGAYTGDNNNRIGLYTYSAGTLTLVASSANNASLWTSAANAIQTIPFSGTYSATAGLYVVAFLYNNSAQTTAPALASGVALNNLVMASTAMGFTNSAKLHGTSTGNDLSSSITMSSITASVIPSWVALY